MPSFQIQRSSVSDDEDPRCSGATKRGDEWFIQVETLEELLALMNRAGHYLILKNDGGCPAIEIYDGYRE